MPLNIPTMMHPDHRAIVVEALLPSYDLRKSKPPKASGRGQYVWRMLAYYLSTERRHQCFPIGCDYDLWDGLRTELGREPTREERKAATLECETIIDEMIAANSPPLTSGAVRMYMALYGRG